ncbi:MAG: isocitrate/isopropylmalate dehydrogenase family protein [Planctomycetota bacterium]
MTTKTFEIAVLGGDGIGPEVCDEAVKLVREIEPFLQDVSFQLTSHSVGVGEYQRSGNALPESTFEACRESDAVLLGAMGLPNVRYPNGKEIAPQLDLRERLQLFGGVRPIRLYHEADTPLKGYGTGGIDFVIVRESTEGLFSGRDAVADLEAEESTNLLRISRRGTERVCRMAFEVARQRDQDKRVALIDKANVLSSMVYMRHFFDEVAKEFPDCEAQHVYVDASTLFLVQRPNSFDVMVTENMFGDILSDLAAGLVGGMGMAPSGDIGADAAVFQPSHGSAPDIAGQGIANPVAMILSAAMMLDWLESPETKRAAQAIRDAVQSVFTDTASRTRDMGGKMSTSEMGAAICSATVRHLSAENTAAS